MGTEDVIAVDTRTREIVQASGDRYTAHIFDLDSQSGSMGFSSGAPVRAPTEQDSWPPDILFDVVYASAIVSTFGVVKKEGLARWRAIYYPPDIIEKNKQREMQIRQEGKAEGSKSKTRSKGRTNQASASTGQAAKVTGDGLDGFDVIRFLPYMYIQPEAKLEYDRRCQEDASARQHQKLIETVNSWRAQALMDFH